MSGRALAFVAALLVAASVPRAAAWAQERGGGTADEEELLRAGQSAFVDGRDDEALRIYEQVSAIDPARPEAWVRRGAILYRRQDYAGAAALLRRAREVLPDDVTVVGQLGLALYRAGETDEAVALLVRAAGMRPEAFEVQLQLGQHWVRVGDGERALSALEAYRRHRPEAAAKADLSANGLVGVAYRLLGRLDDARRELELVLRSRPDDRGARVALAGVLASLGECSRAAALAPALEGGGAVRGEDRVAVGRCLVRLRRRAEAGALADAVLGGRNDDPGGRLLRGELRAERGERALALADLDVARGPGAPRTILVEAARLAGSMRLEGGDAAGAAAAFEQALGAAPDDAEALAGLAEALAKGRADPARLRSVADRLDARGSSGIEARVAAGLARLALGEDAAAADRFAAARKDDPTSMRATRGLVTALQRSAVTALDRGDAAGAERSLRRALEVLPGSVEVARNLAIVLLDRGRLAEAEQVVLPAIARAAGDPLLRRLAARALAGQDRHAEAMRHAEAAIEAIAPARGPALAEAQVELGPIYVALGRLDEAVGLLETAAREAGTSPSQTAALRNLAIAYVRRGLSRLRDPRLGEAALEDLSRASTMPHGALTQSEEATMGCVLALAALKAGRPGAAADAIALAAKEGACALRPPWDRGGLELLAGYAEFREAQKAARDGKGPARLEAAARTLTRTAAHLSPPLDASARRLTASALELAAIEHYERGDVEKALASLRAAQRLDAGGDRRDLEHNLAALDLAGGAAGAERALEALAARVPEALVNLGIAKEKAGEPGRALELWRKAVERGAKTPRLREWIEAKERLLGAASGAP